MIEFVQNYFWFEIMIDQQSKDVEDSNEIERLYRRNSLFTASVIAIYSLAGGRFGDDVTLGLAKVTFSKPVALEYSMIVVALYYCWRHWLVSKLLRIKLLHCSYNSISEFNWVSRSLNSACEALKETVIHFIDGEGATPVKVIGRSLVYIGFFKIKYQVSFENKPTKVELRDLYVSIGKMPFVFVAVNLKYRWAWLKNAATNTHFGDGLLPLSLTILALLLYAINLCLR